MGKRYIWLLLTLFFNGWWPRVVCAQPLRYQFSLAELAKTDLRRAGSILNNDKVVGIFLKSDSASPRLTFPGVAEGYAWANARFLNLEIEHDNPFALIVYLDFFEEASQQMPSVRIKTGILPRLKTQAVIPLLNLSGKEIYLPKNPRQMKTYLEGTRINPKSIQRMELHIGPVQKGVFSPQFKLSSAYLSDEKNFNLPKLITPYVDSLGQYAFKRWPGKTRSRNQMRAQLSDRWVQAQKSATKKKAGFGGYAAIKFEGTGFFRTHFDGKRWWLVDPQGSAFLSSGVDAIRPGTPAPIEGIEDLYAHLPGPEAGKDIYSHQRGNWSFNSLAWNLKSTFGVGWKPVWNRLAAYDLADFGFNSIGNWSDPELIKEAKLPYVFPMSRFPVTQHMLFRDFPDVFDPTFEDSIKKFASQLEALKSDPYLIGYFLRNEPEWAFGNHNLAYEMLQQDFPSFTRRALVSWLSNRYAGNISRLNEIWHTTFPDFQDLATGRIVLGPEGRKDLVPFTEMMVDSMIAKVCREVKRVDPNHLNLGMRYAWISSDLCYRAGSYFDVFSLNGYSNFVPSQSKTISEKTGKPVLIGEFHFGALDRGLPASGIVAAASTKDRALAIQSYVEEGFSRPEVIGIHYFLMYDQPLTGRFDGENYNVGLFDICLKPYPELKLAIRKANRNLYSVATGRKKPFIFKHPPIAPLYY